MPTIEQLEQQLAEARAASTQGNIPTFPVTVAAPVLSAPADPYAPTVWAETEYDFCTPSGQLCRLKKVDITELAQKGILDKVTRLPGLAGEVIAKSEGAPPAKPETVEMPSPETLSAVVDTINTLIPLVVVKPEIWPLPEPDADGNTEARRPERIYVDSIEIMDRIAIMNRALGGLQKLDAFRDGS